jgi:hypothetical protein
VSDKNSFYFEVVSKPLNRVNFRWILRQTCEKSPRHLIAAKSRMSDLKTVQMSIPVPAVKASRRSKKQKGLALALAPADADAAASGNDMALPNKSLRVTKTNPQKPPILLMQQKAGNPLPALSSSSVVGGKPVVKVNIIKPTIAVGTAGAGAGAGPYNKSPLTPSPQKPIKIMTLKKPLNISRKAPEPVKVNIKAKPRPNRTLKKYTAKKITISIEPSKNIRKTHDAVRRKVANMPLEEVTKKLRGSGLIRDNANPPEMIQRSMMKDILLFPTPM